MPLRSPDEADRHVTEMAEAGLINDAQERALREEVNRSRAEGFERVEELAESRYEDAQRFGSPALDTFNANAAAADALADALAHGLDPAEGRRQLDSLLAQQAEAEQRQEQFRSAAEAVREMDADPAAANEDFLRRHPLARTEFTW